MDRRFHLSRFIIIRRRAFVSCFQSRDEQSNSWRNCTYWLPRIKLRQGFIGIEKNKILFAYVISYFVFVIKKNYINKIIIIILKIMLILFKNNEKNFIIIHIYAYNICMCVFNVY